MSSCLQYNERDIRTLTPTLYNEVPNKKTNMALNIQSSHIIVYKYLSLEFMR